MAHSHTHVLFVLVIVINAKFTRQTFAFDGAANAMDGGARVIEKKVSDSWKGWSIVSMSSKTMMIESS